MSLGGKVFSWRFLLAAVQFPIIGVVFLHHFGLLVDPAGNRLVDRLTMRAFHGSLPEPGVTVALASSLRPGFSLLPGVSPSPASPGDHRPLLTGLSSPASPHRPLLYVTGLFCHLRHAGGPLGYPTCKSALRVSWGAFGGCHRLGSFSGLGCLGGQFVGGVSGCGQCGQFSSGAYP